MPNIRPCADAFLLHRYPADNQGIACFPSDTRYVPSLRQSRGRQRKPFGPCAPIMLSCHNRPNDGDEFSQNKKRGRGLDRVKKG